MIEDKIKLIDNRESVAEYLKINGISGNAKERLLARWDEMKNAPQTVESDVEVNIIKTSVIEDENLEIKEE